MKRFLLVVVSSVVLSASAAEPFTTSAQLFQHYLEERAWIAPIIPPFDLALADKFQKLIAADDFSFQQQTGWYFPWDAAPEEFSGELVGYANIMIYEDLEKNELCLIADDKIIARGKTESFPSYAGLSGAAYEKVLLAELNRRSIVLRIPAQQGNEVWSAALALEEEGGGYAMMSMGGQYELEAVDLGVTNDGMAVTFAWPEGSFTNRLDIYAYDGESYNGLGSWKLADIGYSTLGTNQLVWVDTGQLGRGNPLASGIRLYAAGKGGDVDSDTDGYSDAYEHLVLNTDPNNGDTDGDNVSDGPFDPDNTNSIMTGPDAFPLDASEWLDTDGDGIGDNADTDDDGDGKPDSVETNTLQRLMPITIAPFRAVTVESADPSGDDSGTEVFDVSSAGRMLPYASGGDARGFGQIHGGIYFNNDGTNLYIGVAGFEKSLNGDPNVLMLFLDTDSTNGGASTLSGIDGNPSAFGIANNLSFNPTSFTPNVGILVGNRYADGKNDPTSMGRGQGVYALTPTTMSDFSGFSSSSGAISQWGDRGADSANAGIEIALSLNSLGLAEGDTFRAAAIVAGGPSGNNRWFSGECYGESVSGTLNNNDFRDAAVTLIGAEVFLSDARAPEPSEPPPFTDSDVILQGYYWQVPRVASSNNTTTSIAGNFNGWTVGANPMTLVSHYTWEYIHTFSASTNLELKFVTDGGSQWWGDSSSGWLIVPLTNVAISTGGGDIWLTNVLGTVRFRAYLKGNDSTFTVDYVASTSTTKLLSGYSAKFWYPELTQLAQSGRLDRFAAIWLPPPQKCNSGRDSSGYDPFDYYDIGSYPEKFSTETRYGSEGQLKTCVNAMRDRGILPIVDLVLNHMNGGYTTEGGTNRYNYQPASHETFEKPDPTGNNSNQYYTVNYGNQPFSYDVGFGNADGVQASDGGASSADVNQRHPYQRQGLKNWATWVSSKAGYRGYRWDVAQNIEPWFISELMNYTVMKGQPSVMEYWTTTNDATVAEFDTWIELTDRRAALFDQLLYNDLQDMCNQNGTFNMGKLATSGLLNRRPQWAVTLAGDHDKVRPYGEGTPAKTGIFKDKPMAFAFILISEGTPMIQVNDYLVGAYADLNPPNDPVDDGWTGEPMTNVLDSLIDARKNFAGGSTTYLSQSNTNDLFIMKRNGTTAKPGCILVLNDHVSSELTDTVSTGWVSTNLVDFINTNVTVSTDGSGNAVLSAPARGYRVYVRHGDL